MKPRGPYWSPRFPPQGHWEKVPASEIRRMFRRAFTRWGLPDAVRVDNGYPWGTPRDLPTELALWLIGLGVEVIWNPPAQPRENPKVERCHGVVDSWAEPYACSGPAQLKNHLDWVCRTQCHDYPSIHGASRVAAFPKLLIPRRPYDTSRELELWSLDRVDQWMSQGMWVRRVGKTGTISMYGHRRSLGRNYSGQEVVVRFAVARRYWVVADSEDNVVAQFPASELSKRRIMRLAVGRKRCQRRLS
jgi:hypothetical protein